MFLCSLAAVDFADEMLKEGVYVIGFSYPVVPKVSVLLMCTVR